MFKTSTFSYLVLESFSFLGGASSPIDASLLDPVIDSLCRQLCDPNFIIFPNMMVSLLASFHLLASWDHCSATNIPPTPNASWGSEGGLCSLLVPWRGFRSWGNLWQLLGHFLVKVIENFEARGVQDISMSPDMKLYLSHNPYHLFEACNLCLLPILSAGGLG